MDSYAVGSARPDRWAWGRPTGEDRHWHAVEAHRPADELDGEVELAVCGAIVHVEAGRRWAQVGAGRGACPECRVRTGTGVTGVPRPVSAAGR